MGLKTLISNVTADLSRLVSKVCRPEPQIDDDDVASIKTRLKNGDCIVTRVDYELSNFVERILTGSFYGHAAIYLDGMIYEAVTAGVRKVSLERFLFSKDGIGLCRLPGPDWTPIQVTIMKDFCEKQLGDAYDYSISWGKEKKWYCSKLVYKAWKRGGAEDITAVRATLMLGQKRVTPQDIWNSLPKICVKGVTS